MRKYNVTILDKDTMIERVVETVASSARDAHKSTIWSLNDLEMEEVVNIKSADGELLYTNGNGFMDIADQTNNY